MCKIICSSVKWIVLGQLLKILGSMFVDHCRHWNLAEKIVEKIVAELCRTLRTFTIPEKRLRDCTEHKESKRFIETVFGALCCTL